MGSNSSIVFNIDLIQKPEKFVHHSIFKKKKHFRKISISKLPIKNPAYQSNIEISNKEETPIPSPKKLILMVVPY
jgi:hypothetical protein